MNLFQQTLEQQNITLLRDKTDTLQINVGRLCNLACKHCHIDAGPSRTEVMSRQTMDEIIRFARDNSFSVIDITGGAPELVPEIEHLLKGLAPLAQKTMLRTNFIALLDEDQKGLLDLCCRLKVALVGSFPSTNKNQTDAQRGDGVWQKSLDMLHRLNELGYGRSGTGLELYLVSNPTGAFMPVNQCTAEKKFKADLARKWGIEFTSLFTFANIPLGRFKDWLERSGNYDAYMEKLSGNFNPETLDGLMCKSLISISWDGYLYDCDFNLAACLPYSGSPVHITDLKNIPPGTPIMTDAYCFACTAGAGFT